MKKIGILRGMETTFPDGLIAHINDAYADKGVHAEFVELGGVIDTGDPGYAVILDRISHEIPFYRSYLKWASLKGTYVANNPFWWSADDKFIDNVIAERAGVAVPRTVILPHRDHPANTETTSFRNLQYPLDWERVFEYVGFPAFLKPHDGGGWRGVTKVRDREEFFAAYNASGTDCMMLQEGIEFEEYYRCYGIGQRDVYVMRYNPGAEMPERYSAVPSGPVEPARLAKLERDVLALCRALGYDMNTVEFAVRDGIPYAIDFMNPAPDADYWSVGQTNYEWVIRHMAAFLVEKALDEHRPAQFTANGVLEPGARHGLLGTVAEAASAAAGAAVEAVKRAVKARKGKAAATASEASPVPAPGPETAPKDSGDAALSIPDSASLEVRPSSKRTSKRGQATSGATSSPASSKGNTSATKARKGSGGERTPDQERPAPKSPPAKRASAAGSSGDVSTAPAPKAAKGTGGRNRPKA